MLWSGSSPLTVVRDSMWGFLMFAGVAWLAIGWSVLRLEPADIVSVAGPVILFGALCEAVRALRRNADVVVERGHGGAVRRDGVVLLADQDSSYTTPAALIGWYLMVRGAADVAVSMMTRDSDRIWGLLMVVGVAARPGLGFFAASPLSRTADLVIVTLGGLGVVAGGGRSGRPSLRLREVSAARAERPAAAAGAGGGRGRVFGRV